MFLFRRGLSRSLTSRGRVLTGASRVSRILDLVTRPLSPPVAAIARKDLLEAQDIATAVGLRSALWPVLFALSRLEPDPPEARRLQRQAREIVETIASHIGAADLQASFLNQPAVATLLS